MEDRDASIRRSDRVQGADHSEIGSEMVARSVLGDQRNEHREDRRNEARGVRGTVDTTTARDEPVGSEGDTGNRRNPMGPEPDERKLNRTTNASSIRPRTPGGGNGPARERRKANAGQETVHPEVRPGARRIHDRMSGV